MQQALYSLGLFPQNIMLLIGRTSIATLHDSLSVEGEGWTYQFHEQLSNVTLLIMAFLILIVSFLPF